MTWLIYLEVERWQGVVSWILILVILLLVARRALHRAERREASSHEFE